MKSKFAKKVDQRKLGRRIKKALLVMEILMSIPFVSWAFVSFTGFPIFVLLFFHTFSLVLSQKTNSRIQGNVFGIFGGFLSIMPIIGWGLHVTISIVLFRDLLSTRKRNYSGKTDVITSKAN